MVRIVILIHEEAELQSFDPIEQSHTDWFVTQRSVQRIPVVSNQLIVCNTISDALLGATRQHDRVAPSTACKFDCKARLEACIECWTQVVTKFVSNRAWRELLKIIGQYAHCTLQCLQAIHPFPENFSA